MRRLLHAALGLLAVAALAVFGPRAYTALRYQPLISDPAASPSARVAIVFGAGLRRDGRPTAVLYDRIATAAELYHAGKVTHLLLSGANSETRYNEPLAMANAARDLGVPEAALVLDYAGSRTYDTCYRAKTIFGLEQAVLVTQSFHLPRAMFLCDSLGVKAAGVSADRRPYSDRAQAFWNFREVLATAAAVWDVTIGRPPVMLGEPLPIPEPNSPD